MAKTPTEIAAALLADLADCPQAQLPARLQARITQAIARERVVAGALLDAARAARETFERNGMGGLPAHLMLVQAIGHATD